VADGMKSGELQAAYKKWLGTDMPELKKP
jgi:hypothetical protein